MLRRRADSRIASQSPERNERASPSSTKSNSKFTPIRRILYIVIPAFGLLYLLHYFAPNAQHASSYERGRSLPGFNSRSGFTNSRRTDQILKKKTGVTGSRPPANFSEPPPFTFCPTFGPTDELGYDYGRERIMKTRFHAGNNDRIRKMIKRALAGHPITIAILGGSVSSCHGIDLDNTHLHGNPIGKSGYPYRIYEWLNDVFPHPANELTNGAIRRTGSAYFGYCSAMHLPDRVDLVVLEFDSEDPDDVSTMKNTDLLVRSILLRPDQPAVVMLGHFSPQIQRDHGYVGPEVWHSAVAHFYDIIHLSVKGLLYDEYLLNTQNVRKRYFIDSILPNAKGHELIADTLISYLESEICAYWDDAAREYDLASFGATPGNLGYYPLSDSSLLSGQGLRKGLLAEEAEEVNTQKSGRVGLPPMRIFNRPQDMAGFREIAPHCASANDLVNPLPSSVFQGSGWTPMAPPPDSDDQRHYWYSDSPGALLKIPVKCGAGDIGVYYLKGPESEGWGDVLCWVDDNTGGAKRLQGSWDRTYGQPVVTQIDQNVSKGNHYVVCELQGVPGTEQAKFKLFGVFST